MTPNCFGRIMMIFASSKKLARQLLTQTAPLFATTSTRKNFDWYGDFSAPAPYIVSFRDHEMLDRSQRSAFLAVLDLDKPMVTVQGSPGSGKTMLVAEFAHKMNSERDRRLLIVCGSQEIMYSTISRYIRRTKCFDHLVHLQPFDEKAALRIAPDSRRVDCLHHSTKTEGTGERITIADVLQSQSTRDQTRLVFATPMDAFALLEQTSTGQQENACPLFDAVVLEDVGALKGSEGWRKFLQLAPLLRVFGDYSHSICSFPSEKADAEENFQCSLMQQIKVDSEAEDPTHFVLVSQYRANMNVQLWPARVFYTSWKDASLARPNMPSQHEIRLDHLMNRLVLETDSVYTDSLTFVDTDALEGPWNAKMFQLRIFYLILLKFWPTQMVGCTDGSSAAAPLVNWGEALLAVAHINLLLDHGIFPSQLACFTLSSAHGEAIRRILFNLNQPLSTHPHTEQVEIGRVEQYLGRAFESVLKSFISDAAFNTYFGSQRALQYLSTEIISANRRRNRTNSSRFLPNAAQSSLRLNFSRWKGVNLNTSSERPKAFGVQQRKKVMSSTNRERVETSNRKSRKGILSLRTETFELGIHFVRVQTTTGKIRGRVLRLGLGKERTDIDVFFGIPYAAPPTGPLRFEKTVPLAENGTHQVDAIKMPRMCVPHHRLDNWISDWEEYSEDCLYINMFTPRQQKEDILRPLLVAIYVGGFEVGTRRYKNYTEIGHKFLSRDIAVATIQFRIGFLGFASSGSAEMPGNFGYWDLTEALRWLRANAKAFGADPSRITLFGYSASSTTVTTLGLSPHSRELFQQIIQMSGPVFSSRGASDRTVNTTQRMADQIGCANWKLKECLKTKSIGQFFEAMDKIGSTLPDVNYDLFGPTFDDDFLPANFSQLVRESKPKPTIIGVNELEPLAFTLINGNNSLRHLAIPREEFATFGREKLRMYLRQKAIKSEYYGPKAAEELAEEVTSFYVNLSENRTALNGSRDNWFFLQRTVLFLADVQFLVPFLWEVREKVSTGWPLFLYVNKYINAKEIPKDFPPELCKSFHDSDHKYVLRHPYSSYEFDGNDLAMERLMTLLFANFVRNGEPSSPDTVHWPPATRAHPFRHLAIDLPVPQPVPDFDLRRVRFWDQIVAKYPQHNLILGTSAIANFATRSAQMAATVIMMALLAVFG
uniref:Carboxylesterase type B domain-containing protein n=1 Tax=Globodera rostochiensis TaxID=31243 RepID=A0A914I054_GLORO